MKRIKMHLIHLRIAAVLLAGALWLAACAPAAPTQAPSQPPTLPPAPTAVPTLAPAPTDLPAPTPTAAALQVTLEKGTLASGLTTEQVAAVSEGGSGQVWGIVPAYTRLTLQGYPIGSHQWEPQVFVFPVKELSEVNPSAGEVIASLKSLIASPRQIPDMPFLPPVNGKSILHAHLQYLDFQGGHGLRYLAQINNGITPINNRELIYTYQGLTQDEQYYVAAIFPVNHPSLPADEQVTDAQMQDLASNYLQHIASVEGSLTPQAANTFTPDLTQLDAVMSSLKVQ